MSARETPPRTWRRPRLLLYALLCLGNTSTDVEKTVFQHERLGRFTKHLHGHGEDPFLNSRLFGVLETPPRTWRRLPRTAPRATGVRNTSTDVEKTIEESSTLAVGGNTSTDVEKTRTRRLRVRSTRKHLHGRGEDLFGSASSNKWMETPPRTWRRHHGQRSWRPSGGNTSTDVEKTPLPYPYNHSQQKHLHGRGEDLAYVVRLIVPPETPPRTWRRPFTKESLVKRLGNTSTDVEKTSQLA